MLLLLSYRLFFKVLIFIFPLNLIRLNWLILEENNRLIIFLIFLILFFLYIHIDQLITMVESVWNKVNFFSRLATGIHVFSNHSIISAEIYWFNGFDGIVSHFFCEKMLALSGYDNIFVIFPLKEFLLFHKFK